MTNPTQKTDLVTDNQVATTSCSTDKMYADKAGTNRPEYDTDLDVVLRVQSGDSSAFGELIDKHQRSVYGIVSRMTPDRDEADDLVQDIFVSAYKSIGGFRRDAKFSTWLHSIAVNTTLKRLKKMKRQSTVSIDDPATGLSDMLRASGESSPERSIQDSERHAAVRRAIDSLPDKQKIVVIMHYFEQHSCDEIAAILRCSVGTVWSRLHYACKRLRGELHSIEQG